MRRQAAACGVRSPRELLGRMLGVATATPPPSAVAFLAWTRIVRTGGTVSCIDRAKLGGGGGHVVLDRFLCRPSSATVVYIGSQAMATGIGRIPGWLKAEQMARNCAPGI